MAEGTKSEEAEAARSAEIAAELIEDSAQGFPESEGSGEDGEIDFSTFDDHFAEAFGEGEKKDEPKAEAEPKAESEQEDEPVAEATAEAEAEEGVPPTEPETPSEVEAEAPEESEPTAAAQEESEEALPNAETLKLREEVLKLKQELLNIQQKAVVPKEEKAPTPEEVAANEQRVRDAAIEELTKAYTFDEGAIEKLRDSPEEILPRLAAEVTVRAVQQSLQTVNQMLPAYVDRLIKQQQVVQTQDDSFYGRWPALKNPEYEQTVLTVGETYRKLNPQATPEDFIEHVGTHASMLLKLPLGQGEKTPAPPAPKPKPHRPMAARAAVKQPSVGDDNFYAGWAEEETMSEVS